MGKTALVLLDLQNGLLDRFPGDRAKYLEQVSQTIQASRTADIHIVYVKTCFRPGHPEISTRNFLGRRLAASEGFVDGDASADISSEIAPAATDIVVTKRRVSALSGSDLDCVLRGLDVVELVLAGVATSGAVLSTVRQAADLDYGLVVLGDLCLDSDAETHRVLVEKVFPRQATVISFEQWKRDVAKTHLSQGASQH